MPALYNVTLKKDASADELEKYVVFSDVPAFSSIPYSTTMAKEAAQKQGGTIKHTYTLIKGFTVEYADESVGILESNDHIHVEKDSEVKTQ
ncbi:hypothetical protein UCRPC4_g00989 [Phaeomoniella chlamydospora]|uniref:Uncharacterized protein n=1 Tax=Phaeomoniella chlamydospora TaxID=158046 RepID=A0A0G2EY62_PHACM|nr:hypothetical protein UCRPC4_g00989 [Phaeomoniella chlamydospora]